MKLKLLEAARILAFVVLSTALGFTATRADEKAEEGKEHGTKSEKMVMPKALSAVWAAIESHQKELHEVLAAKKLGEVHHHAFAIRDLAAAMPTKSTTLPAEKKTALGKSVSRIVSLAKLLDEAGDGGDSAKVATLTVKLDAELKAIQDLYPAKDLKPTQGAMEGSKAMYVCPMHPEVTSDKPGKCPKCGMNLAMKDAEKGTTQDHH